MKSLIPVQNASVLEAPRAILPEQSLERTYFGIVPTCEVQHSPAALQPHREVMECVAQTDLVAEFVGYMRPLRSIKRAKDSTFEWALMRVDDDQTFNDIQMPSRIARNFETAMRNHLFDDYYIVHAWEAGQTTSPSAVPNTSTQLVKWEQPTTATLPWDAMRSPTVSRTLRWVEQSAKVDQAVARLGRAAIRKTVQWGKVIGMSVMALAAFATVAAVAALSVMLVLAVAVGGAVLVGSMVVLSGLASTVAIDPILYGVKEIRTAQGERIAMLYKLGEWDTV